PCIARKDSVLRIVRDFVLADSALSEGRQRGERGHRVDGETRKRDRKLFSISRETVLAGEALDHLSTSSNAVWRLGAVAGVANLGGAGGFCWDFARLHSAGAPQALPGSGLVLVFGDDGAGHWFDPGRRAGDGGSLYVSAA